MPPNNQIQQDQWLDITDFSPGIFSHDNTNLPNNDRLLPAPKGAADAAGTYSCMCLPNGGLGALPAVTQTYDWEQALGDTTYLVGLLVHNELSDGTTEALAIIEFDDGSNHYWTVYSYIPETDTWNIVATTTAATTPGIFGSPYPQFTRVNLIEVGSVTLNNSASASVSSGGFPGVTPGDFVYVVSGTGTIPEDTTVLTVSGNNITFSNSATAGTATLGFSSTSTPGQPVITFPGGGPAEAPDGQVYLYPDPTAPTVFGVYPMINSNTVSGQVLVHQNRIIVLAGIDYDFPAGGGINVNEQINYTDPPNSAALGFQQTVLSAEEPYGYGCGGSISAGELILIKKRGGGVVMTGDIFSPNVTILPGIQSTGGYYGNASSGKDGFFYCSYENGAWVWNGGNTAVKCSPQLDDNFFLVPELPAMPSNNYGWYTQCIGDKVYFSNNYIYDTRSHSWWKYYPDDNQGGKSMFWIQPVEGRNIFLAPLSFGTLDPTFLYKLDMEVAAPTYQWTSLPLQLATEDRVSDIREVVIRASCSEANEGSITVTVLDKGNTVWGPHTMTGKVTPGPDIIRFNAAALGVTEPQVRVQANSSGDDNVVIHSISVRYKARAHQAVTN